MSETGPYDKDKCFFCDKSAKDGTQYTAGYQRREKFAQQGPWRDACETCVRKPYDPPAQFQGGEK